MAINLPKTTELNKVLPKKSIYEKFNMNTAAKDKFDADIKKLVIVNEISPITTNLTKGIVIESFFVLLVSLKTETFDEKNIVLISKLINQKILFILEYNDKNKLAVYHNKLWQTEWKQNSERKIDLKGLNIDTVWENIIIQIADIEIESDRSLDEQIKYDEMRQKLQKQIVELERQARIEKQPKRKFELVQEIQKIRKLQYE